MNNIPQNEREEAKQEEFIFGKVLDPHKVEIAEIKKAYRLISEILVRYKEIFPSVDIELNHHYEALFALIDKNREAVEEDIAALYDIDGVGLPDHYINTDILSFCYQPFSNLYEPQHSKIKIDWDELENKINTSLAQIEEIARKANTENLNDLPHQALFKDVSAYIENANKLECCGITLDLKKGYIKYNNNAPVTVALDNQPIRLLALLMRNKGHIVEYVTIAQNLGVNFYHENLKNEDLGEPMRDIKKNLRSFLIKIGMTPDEFSSLVTTQKNLGYKLNC